MKHTRIIVLVMALLLLTLSACSSEITTEENTTSQPATGLTANTSSEPILTPPTADSVSEESITVQETPISLTKRPEFRPKDWVQDEELVSLHGYLVGMTFAETQQIWEIPQEMIDYAIGRWTPDMPSLYIFLGNMNYNFKAAPDADINDFDSYILEQIYYGETIFCTNREPLCVLRDIELGDMIEDVLKSLPGDRTPRRWAIDQLYGDYGQPNSGSLEYITNLGFYELRIWCESGWIRLSFGSSGKLWIAEVSSI